MNIDTIKHQLELIIGKSPEAAVPAAVRRHHLSRALGGPMHPFDRLNFSFVDSSFLHADAAKWQTGLAATAMLP